MEVLSMSNKELYELRHSQVDTFRKSGLTADEWCKENDMKISTFRYWLHKIHIKENTATNQENQWMQLTPERQEVTGQFSPIIVRIGSLSIELQSDFDRTAFADVVTAIQRLC